MTKTTKSAIKKIKAAKLTDAEAISLANWFAQTVAVRLEDSMPNGEFFAAQNEIAEILQGETK